MPITKKQVLDYVSNTPHNTNRKVLDDLVTELMGSDNLDTSDANALATDLLTGKTAYVNGGKITGTAPAKEATTITPTTSDQTVAAGTHLTGLLTIKGDSNLLAENIKQGVTIFGIEGTYTAGT